eukprot:2711196-Pyramimonas_sp.AAC.1
MEETLVQVGQQYFGHQVSSDPLYRQQASERAELLRECARLRRAKVGMCADADAVYISEVESRLTQMSQQLRRRRQYFARVRQQGLLEEIEEAWGRRHMAEAMRLSRAAAHCRYGP